MDVDAASFQGIPGEQVSLSVKVDLDLEEDIREWYRDRQCILCLCGYGIIAFQFMVLDEAVPVYAAATVHAGGLALPPSGLAGPLMFGGVCLFAFTIFGYPPLDRRYGARTCVVAGTLIAVIPTLLIPAVSLLRSSIGHLQVAMLGACMGFKNMCATCAFTSSIIMVNSSAPDGQLGRVNGAGQTISAFVRASGPAIGGWIWSTTLAMGFEGHQFVVFLVVAFTCVSASALYCNAITIGRR